MRAAVAAAMAAVLLAGCQLPWPVRTTVVVGVSAPGEYGADGLVHADLGGDGRDDLVVANQCELEVRVARADGGFDASPRSAVTGSSPIDTRHGLLSGDLDGDGGDDVVLVGRRCADGVPLVIGLLATGPGSLAVASTVPLDAAPFGATLTDLDGDGLLDLVLGRGGAGLSTVEVRRGLGDGSFAEPTAATSIPSPGPVVAGDVDGDDAEDVVVGGTTLSTLFGTGDGSLTPLVTSTTPYDALYTDADLGDVDGDGRADLLRATWDEEWGGGWVQVGRSLGDGRFVEAFLDQADHGAWRSARFTDLDGDGDRDVVSLSPSGLLVNANDGTGSFGPPTAWLSGPYMSVLRIGDHDGDGDGDVAALDEWADAGTSAASSSTATTVVTTVRTTDGSLRAPQSLGQPDAPVGPTVLHGDIDGDGTTDLVVPGTGPFVTTYLNRGDGVLTSGPQSALQGRLTGLVDVDGDGDLDLLGSGVHRNDGSGRFTNDRSAIWVLDVALGDLDGDGDVDRVLGRADSVTRQMATGGGTFGPEIPVVQSSGRDIDLADVDGDGALDLLLASSTGVTVHSGDGMGGFASAPTTLLTIPLGAADDPSRIVTADLDGDGRADLAGETAGGALFVAITGGSGPVMLAASASTGPPAVGDVDADGDLDVAVSNPVDGQVELFRNAGAGSFAAGIAGGTWAIGGEDTYGLRLTELADLDADGRADLLGWAQQKSFIMVARAGR